jgi:hypothetical protein
MSSTDELCNQRSLDARNVSIHRGLHVNCNDLNLTGHTTVSLPAVEKHWSRGDNPVKANHARKTLVVSAGKLALIYFVVLGGLGLTLSQSRAQWWTAAPADFEDCAERAAQSGRSKDAKASLLSDCEAKFAGRRKPGGGYTYYDFMQSRHFDIAGPNPTPNEQKWIDEQYTIYLDNHRRSVIAAAFAEKLRQQEQEALEANMRAVPVVASDAKPVILPRPRPRIKAPDCTDPLECGWLRLSSGLKELKNTLFGTPVAKMKRS